MLIQKTIATIVSFSLYMIESSDVKHNDKLIEILSDIYDYFERADKAPVACSCAGSLAYEKWRDIIDGLGG